jgi:hypothetical protein
VRAIPGLRWRFVVASLGGFLGGAILISGLARAAMMAYAYAKFGHYPVRPDTPTLNMFALTISNVAGAGCQLAVGALILFTCVALMSSQR